MIHFLKKTSLYRETEFTHSLADKQSNIKLPRPNSLAVSESKTGVSLKVINLQGHSLVRWVQVQPAVAKLLRACVSTQ